MVSSINSAAEVLSPSTNSACLHTRSHMSDAVMRTSERSVLPDESTSRSHQERGARSLAIYLYGRGRTAVIVHLGDLAQSKPCKHVRNIDGSKVFTFE